MKMKIKRYFTSTGDTIGTVLNSVNWDSNYTAEISRTDGTTIFKQVGTEFPEFWTDNARNIVASKYFYGKMYDNDKVPIDFKDRKEFVLGSGREYSLKQLITRVVLKISNEGSRLGYLFSDKANFFESEKNIFESELAFLILHQKFMWNSPVWFSVGVPNKRQVCSACYILGVEDNLESIFEHAKTEGLIFRDGSGCGTNLSSLRSSAEFVGTTNGKSSGPLSFDLIYDTIAKVTKSGGASRRAARMVILNDNHPDIEEFIKCKSNEERKAKALVDAGFDGSPGGEVAMTIAYQNANYSVRITDEFIAAVDKDLSWPLLSVRDNTVAKTIKARELWDSIATEAWKSGDPGIQFDDTIQKWHTLKNSGKINGSNPCAEFLHLDFTSCNLASINLLSYLTVGDMYNNSTFDNDGYLQTIQLATISMNILIDFCEFPTDKITEWTKKTRPIGLGFSNLGGLLMSLGISYDSDEGRDIAAVLMSTITANVYKTSIELSERLKKEFELFRANKTSFIDVIGCHYAKHDFIISDFGGIESIGNLFALTSSVWGFVYENLLKRNIGILNSQASVLAPCGTIALAMDSDTTGAEPELALVKYKWLVGGGTLKFVNRCVESALKSLGFDNLTIEKALKYVEKHGTIEGFSKAIDDFIEVFDCSFKPTNGSRFLSPQAHIKMLGALSPFVSGAISKTVNLPSDATIDDVKDCFKLAHNLGVKCVSIYRDGSKFSQPLSTSNKESKIEIEKECKINEESVGFKNNNLPTNSLPIKEKQQIILSLTKRRKLENTRNSITHKFDIAGHSGYIMVGLYDDGMPGEVFITMSKEGSFVRGVMDSFATMISIALQYGAPLVDIIDKLKGASFEPSGYTTNNEIKTTKSVVDYLGIFLEKTFILKNDSQLEIEFPLNKQNFAVASMDSPNIRKEKYEKMYDGPPCLNCGSIMVLLNKCFRCLNCGDGGECG